MPTKKKRKRPADSEGVTGKPVELSIWATYRPLFRGKEYVILRMSLFSFVSGMSEGILLVLIANIALGVGAATDGGDALQANLGPLSSLNLSLSAAFLIALVVGLVRFMFQLLSAQAGARLTATLTAEIRTDTFRDYASASWAEQSEHEESDIQDLLLKHVNRTTAAIGVLSNGVTSGWTLAALLVSALAVDPTSALLLAVSGAFLFTIIRPLTRVAKRVAIQGQEAGLAYGQRSLEAIGSSLEIRSFGVTETVIGRLAVATEKEARPTYTTMVLRQLVLSLYQLATIALLLGGLFATYSFLNQPLGSLGAIVVILIRALTQASSLQNAYHSLSESAPYLERLDRERQRFRNARPPSGSAHITQLERLSMQCVSYAYIPGTPAITDVSFEVAAGEAIGIIGPSGSGKSTLIQVLLRLRAPDSGSFQINDTDAAEIEDVDWFSKIALVPQDSRVINDTIRANIAFYRDTTDAAVVTAARSAHIHDEIMAMPDGYDTHLGSRGGALSGGQRQRITIARALLRRPSVLVLDEPTSALDMRSESLVHETFTELKGSVTIFAIAHRLSTLNTCDRIMVMGDGRLQAFGPREDLEKSSDFYRDALRLSRIRS